MLRFKVIAPIVFFLTVFVTNYYFLNSQAFLVHDTTLPARLIELHETLKDGQFPPRWSKNLGFGYGMPLFQYYSPFAYFMAEVFYILNFSLLSSLKLTFISISVLAFTGAYFLGKELSNKWGGLVSATVFSFSAYHAVNVYVRGALSEMLAISLAPWLLYLLVKNIRIPSKKNYVWLTLGFSVFLLSHNISILTFLPFFIIFGLMYAFIEKKLKNLLIVSLSLLHAIAIAAFFLLPAFVTKDVTRVAAITQGYFNYKNHFVAFSQLFVPNWGYGASQPDLHDDMSFYFGNDVLSLIAVVGIMTVVKEFKKRTFSKSAVLFLALLLLLTLSLFLTFTKSRFLWDMFPILGYIQFPWRFLGVATVFASALAAYVSKITKAKGVIMALIVMVMVLNTRFFRPEKLSNFDEVYDVSTHSLQTRVSSIIPDYLPKGVSVGKITPASGPVNPEDGIEVTINRNKTDLLTAEMNANYDSAIKINKFVFPNWKIKINGQETKCSEIDYLYRCPIQKGKSTLELYWSEKGINQTSNLVSLGGILVLFLFLQLKKIRFSQ
ncbi:MAG: 6-pyruvoyl-tetrahydropterin synthase-related protein [Patescibacteria group bacterium]|jgi:hypothetical protein